MVGVSAQLLQFGRGIGVDATLETDRDRLAFGNLGDAECHLAVRYREFIRIVPYIYPV